VSTPDEAEFNEEIHIRIQYPGNANGKMLRPGNLYDFDEWETFLQLHDLTAYDVYRIDFLEDGRMRVHRYRRDSQGNPFMSNLETREIATMEPVTITPKVPIPSWT